jgi:hypothetical protein
VWRDSNFPQSWVSKKEAVALPELLKRSHADTTPKFELFHLCRMPTTFRLLILRA